MRIKKILVALSCVLTGLSCNSQNYPYARIKGENLPINAKYIYLADAYNWEVPIDSVEFKNGAFDLKYKPPVLEPFLASLYFINDKGEKEFLYFRNSYLIKQDGKNHTSSGFLLEKGEAIISNLDAKGKVIRVDVKAGRENDLYQRYMSGTFTIIDNKNVETRKASIARTAEIIKDHPYSFYLLDQIYSGREAYTKDELKEFLSLFDKNVQHSNLAGLLTTHLSYRPNPGEPTRVMDLLSAGAESTKDVNKRKKLNMLIFWASWCRPCRNEIPSLKKINALIKNPDFYMASISIDEDQQSWKKALGVEKMEWDQFLIKGNIKKVQSQYNFNGIPLIVFTDEKGMELKRFSGYHEDQIIVYINFIKKQLGI